LPLPFPGIDTLIGKIGAGDINLRMISAQAAHDRLWL